MFETESCGEKKNKFGFISHNIEDFGKEIML